jgi:phosphopantetheinyl transferase
MYSFALLTPKKIMPSIAIPNPSTDIQLGLWQITETLEELLESLDLNLIDQNHLQTITHPQKQLEFLASRLLIKTLLSNQFIDYQGIIKNQFNQPALFSLPHQVSLTHCKDYTATILHPSKAVGIDMELIREQIRRIQSKFLSEKELAFADNDLEKLTLLWTVKEALYKLYGQKKLTFKNDMAVEVFEIQQSGRVKAILFPQNTDYQIFNFAYQRIDDYFLAYSI